MQTDSVAIADLRLTPEQWKAVGFLAEFAKRMVVFAFPEHKTPTMASNLTKEVYRVTDDMMTGCIRTGTKPSCKVGCFWCCYMRVKVTPLEVLCIVDYLHSCLRPRELSEFRQRLAATDETTRGLNGYQRVCAKMICPLLVDGKCSVYPVRPIGCRVYHSLNVSDCEVPLDDEERSVTIRNDISGLGMGIFAGLTEGLRAVGFRTRLLELIAGMRMAMDEPGLVRRWLAGDPAFVQAEIAHANKIESVHRALVEELGEPWNELSSESIS
jgi:Fe-S-cluster containining protein